MKVSMAISSPIVTYPAFFYFKEGHEDAFKSLGEQRLRITEEAIYIAYVLTPFIFKETYPYSKNYAFIKISKKELEEMFRHVKDIYPENFQDQLMEKHESVLRLKIEDLNKRLGVKLDVPISRKDYVDAANKILMDFSYGLESVDDDYVKETLERHGLSMKRSNLSHLVSYLQFKRGVTDTEGMGKYGPYAVKREEDNVMTAIWESLFERMPPVVLSIEEYAKYLDEEVRLVVNEASLFDTITNLISEGIKAVRPMDLMGKSERTPQTRRRKRIRSSLNKLKGKTLYLLKERDIDENTIKDCESVFDAAIFVCTATKRKQANRALKKLNQLNRLGLKKESFVGAMTFAVIRATDHLMNELYEMRESINDYTEKINNLSHYKPGLTPFEMRQFERNMEWGVHHAICYYLDHDIPDWKDIIESAKLTDVDNWQKAQDNWFNYETFSIAGESLSLKNERAPILIRDKSLRFLARNVDKPPKDFRTLTLDVLKSVDVLERAEGEFRRSEMFDDYLWTLNQDDVSLFFLALKNRHPRYYTFLKRNKIVD